MRAEHRIIAFHVVESKHNRWWRRREPSYVLSCSCGTDHEVQQILGVRWAPHRRPVEVYPPGESPVERTEGTP